MQRAVLLQALCMAARCGERLTHCALNSVASLLEGSGSPACSIQQKSDRIKKRALLLASF